MLMPSALLPMLGRAPITISSPPRMPPSSRSSNSFRPVGVKSGFASPSGVLLDEVQHRTMPRSTSCQSSRVVLRLADGDDALLRLVEDLLHRLAARVEGAGRDLVAADTSLRRMERSRTISA
jgi:hypothetical protein